MKLKPSICLTLITFLLLFSVNVYPETSKTRSIFETKNGQIIITSVSYKLEFKKSVFAFAGDVDVSGEGINMKCQRLELFFKGSLKDLSGGESKPDIEKIVAAESVVITITGSETGKATADQAVYYPDSEEIVLTGNPYIKYGDKYEGGEPGTVITLNIKEESFHVQGTKENKAKAKIRIDSGRDER